MNMQILDIKVLYALRPVWLRFKVGVGRGVRDNNNIRTSVPQFSIIFCFFTETKKAVSGLTAVLF
jgi:hypothetical protein